MKTKLLLSFVWLLSLYACSNHSEAKFELSDNPKVLKISNFAWSYGTTEFNKFNGNFEALDQDVFDLLNGKSGVYRIDMAESKTDKYGNASNEVLQAGSIDADELSRYKDWKYWEAGGGMRKLLYERFISKTDTTTTSQPAVDTTTVPTTPAPYQASIAPTAKVSEYHFSINDLYPIEENRSQLSETHSAIDGTIINVNLNMGLLEVKDLDGTTYHIMFYPQYASSRSLDDLNKAMSVGNRIKAICALREGTAFDLVSADIHKVK